MEQVAKVSLSVGQVLYSSWGYDQTNIDFYEVVKGAEEGKFAVIRQLKQSTTETGFMSGHTSPATGEDRFTDKYHWDKPNTGTKVKVRRGYQGRPSVKTRKWGAYATLLDRESVGCSWYA